MTSYSNVQKQQLSQLGAYLQEKRQEQGKSLEDISLQTYIRAQLIKAVENGDTSDLPQPIFVQGFIRRYADALGLDGANFSKQFPVHSIPDTPRPTPRPAAQVDMSYQTAAQKPPVQSKLSLSNQQKVNSSKPNVPKPNVPKPDVPKPKVGAMPVQIESTRGSTMGSAKGGARTPEKMVSENAIAPDTAASERIPLDPTPMADSELAAVGLNTLDKEVADESSGQSYQSSPFTQDVAVASASEPVTSPDADSPISSALVGSRSSSETDSTFNWLPWSIGAVAVVGAIALIGSTVISNNQQTAPTETSAPQTDTAQTDTPTEPIASADPTTSASSTASAVIPEPEPVTVSDAPVNLQVEITEAGPSWMSVEVDGEIAFDGFLDPGAKELWEGQEAIIVTVGNAGAAMISANGNDPVPAGDPGDVERLTFTAEE